MYTVLHTESSKGWGGQENRILHESVGIEKLGARVIIACQPGSRLIPKAEKMNIQVITCSMRKSYDVPGILYLMRLIKNERVDIVNTHSGKDSFLAAAAGRLSRRRPVIVRTRHLALPITSKISYSHLPHRIVTVSESVRQYLIRDEGINPDKVVSVPTGVDLERFDPATAKRVLRPELGLADDTPLIGTVAIFRKKKGHHVLLDAVPDILKARPDAVFILAGDGPTQDRIKLKVNEMGLQKNVLFLGLRQDVPDILKSLDVFVLPTLQEALGTSVLEAMAMGVPVISSNIDGVPEIVKDGVTGLLVEPNDPRALSAAVKVLLDDRDRARTMGTEGRRFVENRYSVNAMVNGMHKLYVSLLKEIKNRDV